MKHFFSALWKTLTVRKNSLVGRLIRLASVWFIFSLVITGIALTVYFRQVTLERFQTNVGQIADNLYADTDIGTDGQLITPSFSDTRTNRVYSGLYWQVSEIDSSGHIIGDTRSRSLWNARIGLPDTVLDQVKTHLGKRVYYDVAGPQSEPLRVAAIYSVIDKRTFVFMAAEDRRPMDKGVQTFALVIGLALLILALGSLAEKPTCGRKSPTT